MFEGEGRSAGPEVRPAEVDAGALVGPRPTPWRPLPRGEQQRRHVHPCAAARRAAVCHAAVGLTAHARRGRVTPSSGGGRRPSGRRRCGCAGGLGPTPGAGQPLSPAPTGRRPPDERARDGTRTTRHSAWFSSPAAHASSAAAATSGAERPTTAASTETEPRRPSTLAASTTSRQLGCEPRQSCVDDRLHRRWHREGIAERVTVGLPSQLGDEERVAAGRLDEPAGRGTPTRRHGASRTRRLGSTRRCQPCIACARCARSRRSARRPRAADLGAPGADHDEAAAADAAAEVGEEAERGHVRPVQVVQEHDGWPHRWRHRRRPVPGRRTPRSWSREVIVRGRRDRRGWQPPRVWRTDRRRASRLDRTAPDRAVSAAPARSRTAGSASASKARPSSRTTPLSWQASPKRPTGESCRSPARPRRGGPSHDPPSPAPRLRRTRACSRWRPTNGNAQGHDPRRSPGERAHVCVCISHDPRPPELQLTAATSWLRGGPTVAEIRPQTDAPGPPEVHHRDRSSRRRDGLANVVHAATPSGSQRRAVGRSSSRLPHPRHAACSGMSEEQLRLSPRDDQNSVAWLLWHIARCEDVVGGAIFSSDGQVLDDGLGCEDGRRPSRHRHRHDTDGGARAQSADRHRRPARVPVERWAGEPTDLLAQLDDDSLGRASHARTASTPCVRSRRSAPTPAGWVTTGRRGRRPGSCGCRPATAINTSARPSPSGR